MRAGSASLPQVWLLAPLPALAGMPLLARAFEQSGLGVVAFSEGASLHARLAALRSCSDYPVLALLAAPLAENCKAAGALRAGNSRMGIIVLSDPHDEAGLIRQLHSGADAYCGLDASPALVASLALGLYTRLAPASRPEMSAVWQLRDKGWLMHAPDGSQLALSMGERAFLRVLSHAPGARASHASLLDAVNRAYAQHGSVRRALRLNMLVSRLRQKCREQGVALPLKSVHDWGYMFAAVLV